MRGARALLISDQQVTEAFSTLLRAACTAGFQWWRSGDITRMQNVSEYMLVLALCLVVIEFTGPVIVESSSSRCISLEVYCEVIEICRPVITCTSFTSHSIACLQKQLELIG